MIITIKAISLSIKTFLSKVKQIGDILLNKCNMPVYNTMLNTETTLTRKWQITLTKPAREMLGIDSPGKYILQINPKTKTILIKRIKKTIY